MYVPGKLSDTEKVVVEIGTGYYVEKDIPAAREYFAGKVLIMLIIYELVD